MKARISHILICLLLPLFSACLSDPIEMEMGVEASVQVKLTVDVKAPVATKGLNDIVPSSLMVLAYDTDGNFIKELPILKTSSNAEGKLEFLCALDLVLPADASATNAPEYKFVVLSNSTNKQYGLSYKNGIPDIETLDFAYPFLNTVPMWGVKTYTFQYENGEPLQIQNLGTIDVLRSAAKVGVKLSEQVKEEGYTIENIKINYVAGSGYSVPNNWNTVANTEDLNNTEGFRPADGVVLTDVDAFSVSSVIDGMHYIYIPEIANDEELSMSVVVKKGNDVFEFPYEKGIKFRTYVDGQATDEKFNVVRNHFYDYTITAIHTSIELELIEYTTLPFIEEEVEIGGDVAYLILNTDLVQMYSENVDATTLKFISSSPITSVVLKDCYKHDVRSDSFTKGNDNIFAYYVGKYGQKTQLGTDPGFDITDKEAALAKEQVILANISAVAEADVLQGGITITSPFMEDPENEIEELQDASHYDTIRYLEFEVTNEQGLTEIFRVMQYPPIIISNIQGYFSYRSDYKLTDDQEEPSHFHNYTGYTSFHLTGLYFYHEHEWSAEFNQTQEWWDSNPNERSYAWVVPSGCPDNNKNDGSETVHYSNIGHTVNWGGNTKTYGGLYRPTEFPTDWFVRWRYNGIGASNNDSQGLSIGAIYQKEDGKWYRKHYVWNVNPIFYSRYVDYVYPADEGNRLKGESNIYPYTHKVTTYYGQEGSGWGAWSSQENKYHNHRMYHIRTNTTSPNYVLGRVSIVDENADATNNHVTGVTENTKRNAAVLSPSFMIASQLGETDYQSIISAAAKYKYKVPVVGEFYKLAEEHCREYVETTFIDKDGDNVWDEDEEVIHYDDWRLPTKVEIDMIIETQARSRAMDRLLVGQYYFCVVGADANADVENKDHWVSTEVPNYDSGKTGYYIRCVRDVYED